jgi:predicted 2-oxoglutarate/Fe(II)-dependent dioxygenase YbiX
LEFFESHGSKTSGFSSVFIDGKTIEAEKVRDLAWSKGTVLVFCSRDWHRVTPITKGIRYSLVSWILGPNLV